MFEYEDSFSPVATDTSTRILIALTLYYEKEGRVSQLWDVESELLHPNIPVEMIVECPEVIVDLGTNMKGFLEEYYILLRKSMYGNVDADLLWLRLLAKYLINKCNPKISNTNS